MGICQSKKSIEQIIHSKYTLAKDSINKLKKQEYNHVYLWRYTADDLAQKEVKFYDNENDVQMFRVRYEKRQGQGQELKYQQRNLRQEYLQGQPMKWPIKAHSDEGYIILTVKNNTKHMQVLTNKLCLKNNNQNQLFNSFRNMKIPIQLSEILYMIKLDSFREYFYTKIQQENIESQYEAQIEIIVGDLLQRIDCLKLVSIGYQLEKYLKRGGQNVLKMFYNQYQHISYMQRQQQSNGLEDRLPQQHAITKNKQVLNNINNRETIIQSQIPVQRIFSNQISRINKSQNYPTQSEKQLEINKLFQGFLKTVQKFNILHQILFHIENHVSMQKSQLSDKKSKKFSKLIMSHQTTENIINQIIQVYGQNLANQQHQKINLFHSIKRNQILTSTNSKNTKQNNPLNEFESYDENDISIIENPKDKKNTNRNFRKEKQNDYVETNQENEKMDASSPFICEITEIDGLGGNGFQFQQQNKIKSKESRMRKQQLPAKNMVIQQQGNVDDSLFLPKQLQELQINKSIYELKLPQNIEQQQPSLLLTTYAGSSQFNEIQKRSISLIINLSPEDCYNYFINDVEYDWFYMEKLEQWGILEDEDIVRKGLEDIITDNETQNNNRWLLNIQCLTKNIVHRIESHLEKIAKQQQNALVSDKQNHQFSNVLVFCSHKNMIYSGTVAVAYLMLSNSYRLAFEQAYEVVKGSTNGKFFMPKVYEQQLRALEVRINELSSNVNLNALNTKASSSYRAYEIGLYTEKDKTIIVGRYVLIFHLSKQIGELSTSNQLQILPNNNYKSYFLIPNNLTSIIVKSINILREDASLLNSNNHNEKISNISKLIKNMGLTIRLFCGKELTNQQKKYYLQFVQTEFLSQLIRYVIINYERYEYINFTKKIFNVQKYKAKIELIVQALKELISAEVIEKSFRKPQQFDQHPLTIVTDVNLLRSAPQLQLISDRQQPFNSKQILTFKYPILRPIFESKKKDSYYFMIKKFRQQNKKDKQMGCNVTFYKGDGWIGLEQDKQRYFEKIVQEYLTDVHEQRIWIEDEQSGVDQSLFDRDSILM